jgi:hypothetical protein
MNKGLFYHLVITLVAFFFWMFIVGDTEVTREDRFGLFVMILCCNVMAWMMFYENIYDQKIKLW